MRQDQSWRQSESALVVGEALVVEQLVERSVEIELAALDQA